MSWRVSGLPCIGSYVVGAGGVNPPGLALLGASSVIRWMVRLRALDAEEIKSHTHATVLLVPLWEPQHSCHPPLFGNHRQWDKKFQRKNNPALVPAALLCRCPPGPLCKRGGLLLQPLSWSPGAFGRQLPLQHSWCCCCQIGGPWVAGIGRGRHHSDCRSSQSSCTAPSAMALKCRAWLTPCHTPAHCRRTGPAHVHRTHHFRQRSDSIALPTQYWRTCHTRQQCGGNV